MDFYEYARKEIENIMLTVKKMFTFLLSVSTAIMIVPVSAGAQMPESDESHAEISPPADIYDGGYDIRMENGLIVEISDNGKTVMTAEYENGKRIAKNGTEECRFVYNDGRLTTEFRGEKVIHYNSVYNSEDFAMQYESFTFNDILYYYNWDESGRIAGITDSTRTQIARYVYDGLQVVDVLAFDGSEWVSNTDITFIGNENKLRMYGAYLDEETGWYYSDGMYDDVTVNKIVGLYDNNEYLSETNPYSEIWTEEGIMPLYYEGYDVAADEWATMLLSNSSFNAAASENFYSSASISTVEIIARVIYGENCARTLDQRAIAWIILNKYHYRSNGKDIRSICSNPDNFSALLYDQARKAHSSSDVYWRNATYLACLILTNNEEACWNEISPKPLGITNQVYFRSGRNYKNVIYEENGVLFINYGNGGVPISNACIAGVGTAVTISVLDSYMKGEPDKYNVYFYHED